MRIIHRSHWVLAVVAVVVVVNGLFAASCAGPAAQPATTANPAPSTATTVPPTATTVPPTATTVPPTATTVPPTATTAPTSGSQGSQQVNLDDILPPGEGRDLVLNNCASCHSFVCAVMGQRTAEHWGSVEANHPAYVGGLPEEDFDALFAYLAENFNDTKPEPVLPEALRQQGCTTQD